jgi:hypothetical protein
MTPAHRPSARLPLWTLALCCSLAAKTAGAEPRAVAPIVLPQARIDAVDISGWPKVRVLATILDRRGQPVEVKAINSLIVQDATSRLAEPHAKFKNGQPLDGRKDAKIWPASKAGVAHAAAIVVVGHQHHALRSGSLGRRLKESVGTLLKRFGKTDRGQIFFYADRVKAWWGLKNRNNRLSDVEQTRSACADARADALSGGEITSYGTETQPPPGTDLCGLRGDAKDAEKVLESEAFSGFFPRLFNLGLPFFHPKRYPCKLPKETLDQYGQLKAEDWERENRERDAMKLAGQALDYETSALDMALRVLLRDGRPNEHKTLVLLSDGKDGYLFADDMCRQKAPPKCADLDKAARDRCVSELLDSATKQEQVDFARHAAHWIGVARAAGIRIFAVGIGSLGERWELDRLRVLAERTGGTYREAAEESDLAGAVNKMGAELFDQVVIDFEHQLPAEAGDKLELRLDLELEPTMVAGETKLVTGRFELPLPEPKTWRQVARDQVQDILAQAQDALGYRVYVWVGVALLVVVALVLLLITFFVVRGFIRLIGRIVRRSES